MKRTVIAAAVAALLAGTTQAAVTEFVIFKRPDFQGDSHVVKGEVANLANDGGYWEVCTQDHFKGELSGDN